MKIRTIGQAFAFISCAVLLSSCGGGSSSAIPQPSIVTPVQPSVPAPAPAPAPAPEPEPEPTSTSNGNVLDDATIAGTFLAKMTFGPTDVEIRAVQGINAADLITHEFEKEHLPYLPRVLELTESYSANNRDRWRSHNSVFWNDMIEAPDQLRQRIVFALSQLIVVSDRGMERRPNALAHYMDVLGRNAFGNYRDILEEVTYTPAMGNYLTFVNNRKGDPATGRMPDENYAREIMQLFTIGLVELNMDGTPVLDTSGHPIETYDIDDVVGLARVFTGLRYWEDPDFYGSFQTYHQDLVIDPSITDLREKAFLDTVIAEGTGTEASIDAALDALFNHPNTPPFVARQMIQRLTASAPEPAYVRNVAEAFSAGTFTSSNGTNFGTGQRGDMQAMIAAILLDPSQFREDDVIRDATDLGKVVEPVIALVRWARAFNVSPVIAQNETFMLSDSSDNNAYIGMNPFNAESVFNFYRPGYIATGTESGDQKLTVPEFQLLLNGNRYGYINTMRSFVFNQTSSRDRDTDSFAPDYTEEIALAHDAAALADHLDEILLYGQMREDTRNAIIDALADLPISTDTPEAEASDRDLRAKLAITIAVTAPEYLVL